MYKSLSFWRLVKKCFIWILLVSICVPMFGCSTVEQEKTDEGTLRVLIEQSDSDDSDGFYRQITLWIEEFETAHNVTVTLEELPLDEGSRQPMVQKIRTEIMAGKGPDIIFVPAAGSDIARTSGRSYLIEDVPLAMRKGLFYDISEFYDADTELKTEQLQSAVMEAGVLDGARYVLPLRYDIPVFFVETDRFEKTGLSREIFDKNLLELMDCVVAMGNSWEAYNFRMHWIYPQFVMNAFSQVFDYDKGKLALTQEDLETFFQTYQDYWLRVLHSVAYGDIPMRPILYQYLSTGEYWTKETDSFQLVHSLQNALETVAIGKMNGATLETYPLRSVDGKIVADVTFYGAITAGCQNPELAYEFLRAFLTEDFQWERNLMGVGGKAWKLASYGWPVRTEGSVSALAEAAENRPLISYTARKYPVVFAGLTEEDLIVVNCPVDEAQFPIALERDLWQALWTLVDNKEKVPADVDISQLAEEWIEKLQVHIEEG